MKNQQKLLNLCEWVVTVIMVVGFTVILVKLRRKTTRVWQFNETKPNRRLNNNKDNANTDNFCSYG